MTQPVITGRAILLTRPRADSEALAAELAERGWQSIIDPMLEIVYETPPLPDLAAFDSLVFTSRHGVQGFARLSAARCLPVHAVGTATAAAARRAGFSQVTTGPGDAAGLALFLGKGRFLHPCGGEVRRSLGTSLPVYRAHASKTLSAETLSGLRSGGVAAAMFFSPRSARIFRDLAGRLEHDTLRNVWALCLSRAVLESSRGLPWRDMRIAASPERLAMLALADDLAGWDNGMEQAR